MILGIKTQGILSLFIISIGSILDPPPFFEYYMLRVRTCGHICFSNTICFTGANLWSHLYRDVAVMPRSQLNDFPSQSVSLTELLCLLTVTF